MSCCKVGNKAQIMVHIYTSVPVINKGWDCQASGVGGGVLLKVKHYENLHMQISNIQRFFSALTTETFQ